MQFTSDFISSSCYSLLLYSSPGFFNVSVRQFMQLTLCTAVHAINSQFALSSLSFFLSFFVYLLAFPNLEGMLINTVERESKGEKMKLKQRKLHKLLWTEMTKSGIIRLATENNSSVYYCWGRTL